MVLPLAREIENANINIERKLASAGGSGGRRPTCVDYILDMDFRQRVNFPTPIPLLINPADIKKELDKRPYPVPIPTPFKDDEPHVTSSSNTNGFHDQGQQQSNASGSKIVASEPDSDDDEQVKKKKKGKSKDKGKKLSKSGSSESLTSCSTDKSFKRKGKKRRLESLEKNAATSSVKLEVGSVEEGRQMFAWIIDPVSVEDFFGTTWEQRPLYVCREKQAYFSALLSTDKFDQMLREHDMEFTKNIDITSYKNGERETLNPEGRATAAQVWDFYKKGCSIRLLNPQTFNNRIWALNAMLQEYFGCFVGANIYLTPAGTQGFAPHYDDIEAFVLQLEGKKHWKLYAPRSAEEELPRDSSANLKQEEIGNPIMDVVLDAGDLLYFPRGTIHQASALPDSHSLHITISCYQKNTWGDFLEKLLPVALESAMQEDVEFRRGLPRDFLQHLGAAHSDISSSQRATILSKLRLLTDKLFRYAPVDAAADQLAKEYVHSALPPKLDVGEIASTSFGNCASMVKGELKSVAPLNLKTKVRLLRANIVRVVSEGEDEDVVTIYHSLENSREYRKEDIRSFDVSTDEAQAIEGLIHSYPEYVAIGNLDMSSDKEKLQVSKLLWKKGLLMTSKPLEVKKTD